MKRTRTVTCRGSPRYALDSAFRGHRPLPTRHRMARSLALWSHCSFIHYRIRISQKYHEPEPFSRRRTQVRLLGTQCQRRPGRQYDRAAHRLEPRIQPEAARDRRSKRASITRSAKSASPRVTVPNISMSRFRSVRPCYRPRPNSQGARCDPAWPVASGRRCQTTRHHRSHFEWPHWDQCRERLVQGRIHSDWRTVARARRTLSPLERIHSSAQRDLDAGQLYVQRRFLSLQRLHPESEAGTEAASGNISGRKFAGAATMQPAFRIGTSPTATAPESKDRSTIFKRKRLKTITRYASALTRS